MEHTTERRARIATFGVAVLAAFLAITMNRVQASRADSDGRNGVTASQRSETLVAPTTLDPNVVAFG